MSDERSYPGRELNSMGFAVNYHRWILELLDPYIGTRIVEVGAGTGSLSSLLLDRDIESLTALEPSANMYPLLAARIEGIDSRSVVKTMQKTLADASSSLAETEPPDSILYINVLEHIEDDAAELRTAYRLLAPGGRALVFVPAHEWLTGRIDRQLGHYRRYNRKTLIAKFEAAGFAVCFSAYFDLLGILPWWLRYRVLQSDRMEPAGVRIYDRWGVPISRALDAISNRRMGKNIIVVGERPASSKPV